MIKGISRLKKGMSYFIITFFVILIIIAFVVPATMKNSGNNSNILAVVNGENVYRSDFARFADNMLRQYGMDSSQLDEQMTQYLLNQMIQQKMITQLAYKSGVNMTDDYVKSQIVQYFSDDKGVFNEDNMNRYLENMRLSYDRFFSEVKDSLVTNEYNQLLYSGTGSTPDELNHADFVSSSDLKIKLIYVSDAELKNKFADQLQVTDLEVAKALKDNPDEVKDPKTDKERMKQKLLDEKYGKLRLELVNKVNEMTQSGADIDKIHEVTGGVITESSDFKIGAAISVDPETKLKVDDLTENNAFYETFLKLDVNQVSGVIDSRAGFYLFTPLKKDIVHSEGFTVSKSELAQTIQGDKMRSLQNSVVTEFIDNSKVVRKN